METSSSLSPPRPKVKRKFGLVEIEKVLSMRNTRSLPRFTVISSMKRAGMKPPVVMSSCMPFEFGCLIITWPSNKGVVESAGGKVFTSILPRLAFSLSGSLACMAPQPPEERDRLCCASIPPRWSCAVISFPLEFGEGRGDVPHVIVIEQLPGVAVLEACGLGRFFQGPAFLDQFAHVGGKIGEIPLLGIERRWQLHGVRTVAWDHARRLPLLQIVDHREPADNRAVEGRHGTENRRSPRNTVPVAESVTIKSLSV